MLIRIAQNSLSTKSLQISEFAVFLTLLLFSIIVLIYTEKNRIKSILIILASGVLGWFALSLNGIIPLLSGLFAVPMLTSKNTKYVKQVVDWKLKVNLKGVLLGFISSIFLVLTPAIGPTQSAIFARTLANDEEFLFTMGVINGLDIVFAILMFLTFGYSRSGVLNESFSIKNPNEILPVSALAIGMSFIAFILSTELGAFLSKRNFNLDKIKFASLLILIIVSYLSAGALGVLIFIFSGTLGIIANRMKVRMVNLMGSLMIPSLTKKFV